MTVGQVPSASRQPDAAPGPSTSTRRQRAAKRVLDLAGAALLLVLAAPLLSLAALAIRMRMGAPVLFSQRRLGLHGREFALVKLRTMRPAPAGPWDPSRDGDRLTPLGATLRRWSIDELPQLWNVMRGDMSLVGPRPLPVEYGPRYTATQRRRHLVRPGITGWAQINGRNAASWPERLAHDVWYVDHWSLALDLRILVATARAVVGGAGVNRGGGVTMPEFRGE